MSTVAVIDDADDNLADTYQTMSWIRDEISFWTSENKNIRLKQKDDTIQFLRGKYVNLPKNYANYQELIQELTCKNTRQKIYIEWVQDKGEYLYFDLLIIVKTIKNILFDTKILKYELNNLNCIKPAFTESNAVQIITNDDIILLSPIRSLLMKFTEIDTFHNHKLYLGGLPSKNFVKSCKVKYLFNCCGYSNDDDIINTDNVEEIIFDVASWTVGRVDSDDDDDDDNDDDINDQKSAQPVTQAYLQDLQLEYLDKKIDLIDELLKKGNVFIHCLAGAHRSPFITGCYAYKYGNMKGKTSKEIYKWLVQTRDIVQPLGYDLWMDRYHKYLAKQNK